SVDMRGRGVHAFRARGAGARFDGWRRDFASRSRRRERSAYEWIRARGARFVYRKSLGIGASALARLAVGFLAAAEAVRAATLLARVVSPRSGLVRPRGRFSRWLPQVRWRCR